MTVLDEAQKQLVVGGVSRRLATLPDNQWVLTMKFLSHPAPWNVSDLMVFLLNDTKPDNELFRFRTSPDTSDTPGTALTATPLKYSGWLWLHPDELVTASTFGTDTYVDVRLERRGDILRVMVGRGRTLEIKVRSTTESGPFSQIWLGGWNHNSENYAESLKLEAGFDCAFKLF